MPMDETVRPRVLVVDDDGANVRTFERVFRRDFDVVGATSGALALDALDAAPFDVALVDYSMPGMNGLEVLRRTAATHPAVARVLLTAYADLPELVEASRTGLVYAVVLKPWDRADIQRTVASAVVEASRPGGAPVPATGKRS